MPVTEIQGLVARDTSHTTHRDTPRDGSRPAGGAGRGLVRVSPQFTLFISLNGITHLGKLGEASNCIFVFHTCLLCVMTGSTLWSLSMALSETFSSHHSKVLMLLQGTEEFISLLIKLNYGGGIYFVEHIIFQMDDHS